MLRRSYNVYSNSIDALIPELWAMESIAILEENMVMGALVNRDYNDRVASYGETVHTDKPGEFVGYRKTNSDNVTTQDATTTDIEVKLNQWVHVSFVIKDGEQTKAFQDLIRKYLQPAMMANARFLDQCLLAQATQHLAYTAGGLGLLTSSTAQGYLVDLGLAMNLNKADDGNRILMLSPYSEAEMLKTDLFISAERVGDGGAALRNASLGKKLGFNCFRAINAMNPRGNTTATTTTTTANSLAGASSVAITAAIGKGKYCTIAGDSTPLRSTTNSTTLTPTRAIKRATTSGAVVTPIASGAINFASGYAAGYTKEITVDGTGVPKVGSLVAFNSGDTATGTLRDPEYTIIQVRNSGTTIVLDRPLETALADDDAVCYGPSGDYNYAFERGALTLVNRPLALPMTGAGARSGIAAYNGLSMRVTITYDGLAQGHRVTLDSLFGVKVVEPLLGAVLLG